MTPAPKVRVCLYMDADAAELLLQQVGGHTRKRGGHVSKLVREAQYFPPQLTAAEAARMRDHFAAWLTWLDKQGQH